MVSLTKPILRKVGLKGVKYFFAIINHIRHKDISFSPENIFEKYKFKEKFTVKNNNFLIAIFRVTMYI